MTKAQELGITKFPYMEHDANGDVTYFENSEGVWYKWEHDANGDVTYFENSEGYWSKRERDEYGNEVYFENSEGVIIDKRTK